MYNDIYKNMPQKDIHPVYYQKTIATCVCGKTFQVGSTRQKLDVEICSNCHPFYTGEKKLIDTAGKVERFKSRRAAASIKPKLSKKTRAKKIQSTSAKKIK